MANTECRMTDACLCAECYEWKFGQKPPKREQKPVTAPERGGA